MLTRREFAVSVAALADATPLLVRTPVPAAANGLHSVLMLTRIATTPTR